MARFQRIISLMALVAFVLTAAPGANARVVICTGADGKVRLESPFNRCCDDVEHEEHEGSKCDFEAEAVTPPSESGINRSATCKMCSDEFVELGSGLATAQRTAKSEVEKSSSILPMWPAEPVCSTNAADAPPACFFAAPLCAHAPVITVVLRC